jgi:hypothetical protein
MITERIVRRDAKPQKQQQHVVPVQPQRPQQQLPRHRLQAVARQQPVVDAPGK